MTNITEAAIEAASLALHCDACTDDEHDACDRADWAREAEIALRAALPHLQPTIPNTAEALDALAERLGWLPVARPSGDLAARGRALTEDLALLTALNRLVALQPDDQRQADRIEQAAMLEAAQVPDDLVAVMCKIAARGKILTDDLVAIEDGGRAAFVDGLGQLDHRLLDRRPQVAGAQVGETQLEDAWGQAEMVTVAAGIAEGFEGVQRAAGAGPTDAGPAGRLGQGQAFAGLAEGLDDGQAPGQRLDELGRGVTVLAARRVRSLRRADGSGP